MTKQKVTARSIIEQLRFLHNQDANQWALFAELRAGTGYSNQQRIDLFAMHMYPSKRFRSIAYEVKISRADFVHEIEKPEKRKFAESVSHECYFAVPHDMISVDEVPEGWGLYEINAGGPRRIKIARQRETVEWKQTFVASIARRSSDAPPTLPADMWRIAGKDITADDLIELTKKTQEEAIRSAVLDAQVDERRRIMEGDEYRRMQELWRTAQQHLGYHHDMAKALELAVAVGDVDTLHERVKGYNRQVEQAIEALQRLHKSINKYTESRT